MESAHPSPLHTHTCMHIHTRTLAYTCCWRPARPPRSTSIHPHPSPLPFTPPSLNCIQVVVPAPAPTLSTQEGAGSDDYDDKAYESDEAAVVPVSFSDESDGTAETSPNAPVCQHSKPNRPVARATYTNAHPCARSHSQADRQRETGIGGGKGAP